MIHRRNPHPHCNEQDDWQEGVHALLFCNILGVAHTSTDIPLARTVRWPHLDASEAGNVIFIPDSSVGKQRGNKYYLTVSFKSSLYLTKFRRVSSKYFSQWSPRRANGNPIQYSCLEKPRNRGAWRAIVHRFAKSWTQLKWLSTHVCIFPNVKSQEIFSCSTPSFVNKEPETFGFWLWV